MSRREPTEAELVACLPAFPTDKVKAMNKEELMNFARTVWNAIEDHKDRMEQAENVEE